MKIIYIAHPIGGDVKNNLEKIRLIVRALNLSRNDIVPVAPYWLDCHALDDDDPVERERGLQNCIELLKKRAVDEVWLYGDRISPGMSSEIAIAKMVGIPVIAQSLQIIQQLQTI